MGYQVRILDKNKNLLALVDGARWSYSRGMNGAGTIEVILLEKFKHVEIAGYVQIIKDNKIKIMGKIVNRNPGDELHIYARTEEILLEKIITPANYGAVWEGVLLEDVVKDLIKPFKVTRIKDKSQWQDFMVGSNNIDLNRDPGLVLLESGKTDGSITLKFGNAPERFRWSADSDGRFNPEAIVWTSVQLSTNGVNFGEEFDGGNPEEVGLLLPEGENIWVKINLHTNDVDQTPAIYACEAVSRGTDVVDTNLDGEIVVNDVRANYANGLEIISSLCNKYGCEFNIHNGVLNLAENLGVDRTDSVLFRTGNNMVVDRLSDGDEELCNILTAVSEGSGLNRIEITISDPDSIDDYGDYPKVVEFPVNNLLELTEQAEEYLDNHKYPKPQFIANIFYEIEPDFDLGDTVIVADPKTGITSEIRIMNEEKRFDDGVITTVELGRARFNLSQAIGYERPKDGADGRDGKDGEDGLIDVELPSKPLFGKWSLTDKLNLTWSKSEHATGYEIRNNLNWGNESGMIWQGYAHEYRFVPTNRTMILYLRSLNIAGEYSENYDTLNISLTKPATPSLPTVKEFFTAIQISVTPITNNPAILGYRIYLNDVAYTAMAGQTYTHKADPGTEIEVRVAAYDCIGEGDKTAIVMAETHYIDDDDLPDEVIKARHIETTELVTKLAAIEEAYIDMANVLNLTVENDAGLFKFDEDGLEIDTDDFKLVNGTAWFGGILRAGMVQSTSSLVVASSESSERMKAGADYVCDGEDDDVDINDVIGG